MFFAFAAILLGAALLSYPRSYPTGTGDNKLNEHDWNAIVDFYNGFTASGVFVPPVSYIFGKSGSDYYINNAYQTIYGGSDDAGGIEGANAEDVLQAAINNLSSGGTIAAKNGVYSFNDQITGGNGVHIIGESMGPFESFTNGVIFQDTGNSAQPFFDFDAVRDFSLWNLKLYKNGGSSTSGLKLGRDAGSGTPRTKAITLGNLVIDGFAVGLQGSTYGPDDSTAYDCYIGNASSMAIDNMSSMFKMVGGTIYDTPIGFRVDRTGGGHPDCGNQFFGTVWSGADVCIEVIGNSSIRGMTFVGCWFEDVDTMILRTTNATAGTYLGFFNFYGCYGYVNTGADIFDLSQTTVSLLWDGGELYPADDPTDIITNGGSSTVQYVAIRGYVPGQERINFNDTASGLRGLKGQNLILFQDPTNAGISTITAAAWGSFGQNVYCPWRQYEICHATVIYRWNPETASGGLRLAFPAGTAVTGSQKIPGAAGDRTDTIDITMGIRTETGDGDLVLEAIGDGATAPTVYSIELIVER